MDSHVLILLFIVVLVIGILWNNRAAIFGLVASGSYVVARGMQPYSDRDLVHGGGSYNTVTMYQLIDRYFKKYGLRETAIVKRRILSDKRRPVGPDGDNGVAGLFNDNRALSGQIQGHTSNYMQNSLYAMIHAISSTLYDNSIETIRKFIETEMINHSRKLRSKINNTRLAIKGYKNNESKENPGGVMPMIYYLSLWNEATFYDFENDPLLWNNALRGSEDESYSLINLREELKRSEGGIWAHNLVFHNPAGGLIKLDVFDAIDSKDRYEIHDKCSRAIDALYALSNELAKGGSSISASNAAAVAAIHSSDQSRLLTQPRHIDMSESQTVLNTKEMNLANMKIEAERERISKMESTVNKLMPEVEANRNVWKSQNESDDEDYGPWVGVTESPEIKSESEYVVPNVMPKMASGESAPRQVPEPKPESRPMKITLPEPTQTEQIHVPEPSPVKMLPSASRRILTVPPLEFKSEDDSMINIPKMIGRMLYPPGYVPYRYHRPRDESDDEDDGGYHLELNPRDCENVARYRARYGKDTLVNELVRQLYEFPGTNLLTRDSISTMDPAVHIKHHMSSALKHSRFAGERSPAESWAQENTRRKFFDSLVTANPKYCVNNVDLWSAVDKFLKYVPIAPIRAISDLITKYDPRQILDVNVMFGSTIAALALATPQSAMYTGLCKSGFRSELDILANRISGRATFPARITLLSSNITDYRPPAAGFDMIICEIRTRGSEILPTGVPEPQYSDTDSWLTQYVDPILAKISAAMTTGAHVIFMTAAINPDVTELWKHIGQKYKAAGPATSSAGYSILTVTKK